MGRQLLRHFLRDSTNIAVQLTRTPLLPNSIDELVKQASSLVSSVSQTLLQIDLPDNTALESMEAPVFYADVYESNQIHTCLFGFKRAGNQIPLHNHPNMYGFIKVIRGSVQIRSYSWLNVEEKTNVLMDNSFFSHLMAHPVKFEGVVTRTSDDDCVCLTPQKGNIHCITGLEDGATFFDLLVPGYGFSPCTYYKNYMTFDEINENSDLSSKICFLLEIPPPKSYFCHVIPYNTITEL